MEKKAKIIATLGPAISSTSQLKKIIELGVDAFRINFSHNTKNIKNVVNRIRNLEKKTKKRIAIIADLQGIKLRIGKIKDRQIKIKKSQKFIFDLNKKEERSIVMTCYNNYRIKSFKIGPYIALEDIGKRSDIFVN